MELTRRADLRGVELRDGELRRPVPASVRARPVVSAITRSIRHRATTSTGAVVDDPSTAELAALVAEVGRSGRDAFVIVERRADRSSRQPGEHYLQAVRVGADWVVEVRAGGPDRHFRATVGDDRVGDAFTSWFESSTRWHDLGWQHVPPRSSWERDAGLAGAV